MRKFHVSSFLALLAVGAVVFACGDDDVAVSPPPSTLIDSGTDANVADTGPVAPPADDAGTDASDASDAAKCATVSGVYAITGTCTSTLVKAPTVLCIRQNECALKGNDDFPGQLLTGTATLTSVTATAAVPAPQDCSGAIKDGKLGTLSCTGAGITCDMTAAPAPVADADDYCCDVLTQDCKTGFRCMPRGTKTELALVNVCVPDRGTVDLNGTCTRASTDIKDVGNDDCKKGLFCSNGGQATSASRVCRKLCKNNADCATGDACFDVTAIDAGFCMARCSMFNGTGATACGTGNTCRISPSLENNKLVKDTRCDFVGAEVEGASCQFHSDCGAGLGCNIGNKCAPYCDGTHGCTTGACITGNGAGATGFDPALGLCSPPLP